MTTKQTHDNEVYILGAESGKKEKRISVRTLSLTALFLLLLIAGIITLFINRKEQAPEYYFEPEQNVPQSISVTTNDSLSNRSNIVSIEITEETANDVPLLVYTPHHATMSLMVGMPDQSDSTLLLAVMAADIRKDNMEIVGDFILSGQRLARGIAKKGYAAIINDQVTIGLGESTPLLQEAIEQNGSFFRQYPLVHNGELIENKPKNKSIRRALAVRNERVIVVASINRESFHDFSQALIDIGISDAIYLVGGDAYGWYYDHAHVRHEFGNALTDIPDNISYIIWK